MTRQQSHGARAALTTTVLTLSALVMSAAPAAADYRAWFADWDYIGDFQPGDISDDLVEMDPPAGACGFRITDPSYYRWTDDVGNTVTSHDLYGDVIIWIDEPGCPHPFSVRYADDSHTFGLPGGGAVAMEISTNYSAYWVNENGYYLVTCGDLCDGPDKFTVEPPEDIWPLLTVSAFKAVSASIADPRRQSATIAAIGGLSRQVAELQTLLQKQIAERRRTPVAGIEASLRGLEDAASRALAAARAAASPCEAHARRGAYADAFVACTAAGAHVEQTVELKRTAWFVSHPPSTPDQTAGR